MNNSETAASFWLPSESRISEQDEYFDRFRERLGEMQADAWYSRAERRALRMLIHQLGGAVQLDIKAKPNPPECLHLGFGGWVAVSDRELDETKNPISVRMLAQAPSMLESLKSVLKALDRGDAIDVAGIRRLVETAEEAI